MIVLSLTCKISSGKKIDCRHDCERLDLPECESLWCTDTICEKKKKTGELCMCVDFQALNSNARLDVFPLPCITDLLDWLGHVTVVSSTNLAQAY